jgi:predicted dehydrogenase
VVATADELFSEPDLLDLVVVASPNSTHVPLGLAAVAAGLPVVVDKPVAATTDDARRLRDAAADPGLLVSVFHNRRWDGDLRTVQRLLSGGEDGGRHDGEHGGEHDGELGTVHRFESRFERWRPAIRTGVWRENPDPAQAGGLLYDLGSHLVDQALLLFGPVVSVYAEVGTVRPGAEVDDDVFIALTHAGGTRSHLWASSAAADLGPRFRVLGSAGAYVKYGLDPQEAALRAGRTPREPDWGTEPESAWGRLGTPEGTRRVPTVPGAYQEFYAGIRDALRVGSAPPVPIEEAIDVLTVLEAARSSARHTTVVTM